ncbi:MAG: PGPGW domain-containing protein, partial [Thermodesulfobacteriota bacterium]
MRWLRRASARFWQEIARRPRPAALRLARRLAVLVVGGTVLLVGLVLVFTPGPAVLVVPLGLA